MLLFNGDKLIFILFVFLQTQMLVTNVTVLKAQMVRVLGTVLFGDDFTVLNIPTMWLWKYWVECVMHPEVRAELSGVRSRPGALHSPPPPQKKNCFFCFLFRWRLHSRKPPLGC